jgi:phospholipid/cholesterol/gamma-HCH transport system substrate-binding protein
MHGFTHFLNRKKYIQMQQANQNKIRLGIFVSFGMSLFIAAIYFIGQRQQMYSDTFHISGIFKDISGLQVGNNIRFSGINVGIIDNIEQITDTSVRVDMTIEERTRKFIKKNSKAMIGSDGLMGNKIVVISPGASGEKRLEEGDTLRTAQPISIDDIMLNLKITTENTANITDDFAVIIRNIRNGKGTMGKLFSDSIMANNVNEAMINIKQGAGGFKQNMDAASHSIFLRGGVFKKKKK